MAVDLRENYDPPSLNSAADVDEALSAEKDLLTDLLTVAQQRVDATENPGAKDWLQIWVDDLADNLALNASWRILLESEQGRETLRQRTSREAELIDEMKVAVLQQYEMGQPEGCVFATWLNELTTDQAAASAVADALNK